MSRITRKDYLDGKASHADYYRQFVTQATLDWVRANIGMERIQRSTDPHLNDIPLHLWDRYHDVMLRDGAGRKVAEAHNGGVSLSDAVCVAKQAAHMLVESS